MVAPKGSELTYAELDGNFILIYDWLKALGSGANLTPYDAGTTYADTPPTYVSYGGNIYHYINGTPSSGVTPGTDPLTWELVTIGGIAHVQNTDTYLDLGGATQVSSLEVFNAVHPLVKTVAQMQALLGAWVPGQNYIVTDPGVATGQFLTGGIVMVTAVTSTMLAKTGGARLKNSQMAAIGSFETEYDVMNDWFTKVTFTESGSTVIAEPLSAWTCMSNFPFDDGVSNGCHIENCDIASSPGSIYQSKAYRGSSITLNTTGAITNCILDEFSTFIGAALTITNKYYLKPGSTLDNSGANQVDVCTLEEDSVMNISGNSQVGVVTVSRKTRLRIVDATTENIRFGTGMDLLISGISVSGESNYNDVIERNNNTVTHSALIPAAEPLDLAGTDMAGIIIVQGSNTTIDNLTPPANVTNYFDVELRPISGVTLTMNDSTVSGGNIKLIKSIGASTQIVGANEDSFRVRWNSTLNMYVQMTDLKRS